MEKVAPMKSDKSPEEKPVSVQAEAKELMWAAFPPRIEDNRKSYFHRVARELNWKVRRVRAFFHCEAKVSVEELRQLQARCEHQQQRAAQREKDRHELKALLQGRQQRVPVVERAPAGAARREGAGGGPVGDRQGRLPFLDE
jgi:hypothetical protein